jgi:hypothetical protein
MSEITGRISSISKAGRPLMSRGFGLARGKVGRCFSKEFFTADERGYTRMFSNGRTDRALLQSHPRVSAFIGGNNAFSNPPTASSCHLNAVATQVPA